MLSLVLATNMPWLIAAIVLAVLIIPRFLKQMAQEQREADPLYWELKEQAEDLELRRMKRNAEEEGRSRSDNSGDS